MSDSALFGIDNNVSETLLCFIGDIGIRYGTPKDSFPARQAQMKHNEIIIPGKPKICARIILIKRTSTELFM